MCPVWVGYLLLSPLRKLAQNPRKLLAPHIHRGMTVLDVGCAMGFYSLPMARLVGPEGRVLCSDIQEAMLRKLEKRARKAGLVERITSCLASESSLELSKFEGRVDFALAFAVVHEVPHQEPFSEQVFRALRGGGRGKLLISEPRGQVSKKSFESMVKLTEGIGFEVMDHPKIGWSRSVLLRKP